MIIYKITHKSSGKCYIGQTIRSLSDRWNEHCKNTSRCSHLSNAIKKYGENAFTIDIIYRYTTIIDLNNAEEYYIAFYNCMSPEGYNLNSGGKNKFTSEQARLNMSIAHRGQKPWNTGKKFSKERRLKMALFNIGKKHSIETRQKMCLSQKNRRYKEKFIKD